MTLTWLAALLGVAAGVRAQDNPEPQGEIAIRQMEWGFDGKTPRRTFVPLSLLVENTGPTPATGTIRLAKYYGLDQRFDAEFEQTYYVSAFSTKWVQLTPFVDDDFESWRLTWGPQFRHRADVPTPRIGERATVLFAEPDDASAAGSALRRCDAALFPVSVTGADSLRGAVLHAPPFWQGARAQAFREWLECGGRVYLLHGANGEYPRFPAELGFLNQPQGEFKVGAGNVVRLPLAVSDIDARTARQFLLTDTPDEQPETVAEKRMALQQASTYAPWTDFDDYLFAELKQLTKFQRNWWLIYATALLYVLFVCPGSYLLGRRVADWRWFYAGFLAASVVFSGIFARLGQLSSKDVSRTRSIATAYQIADGLYDVTQWTCAASRDGELYRLTTGGSGRLFTSRQQFEAVNGVVRQHDGRFDLDLPSASTCNVFQRTRIEGPQLGLQVEQLQVAEAALRQFRVKFSPAVQHPSMLVCAMYGRTIYQMTATSDGASLTSRRQTAVDFSSTMGAVPWVAPQHRIEDLLGHVIENPLSQTEAFQSLLHQLVGASLRLPPDAKTADVRLDRSIVRLLIYAPQPDELRFTVDNFPDQQGYVLYIIDVPTAASNP